MSNFFNRLSPNFTLLVFATLVAFGAYLFFMEKQRKETLAIKNSCAQFITEAGFAGQDFSFEHAKIVQKLCEDAGGLKNFKDAAQRGAKSKNKIQ